MLPESTALVARRRPRSPDEPSLFAVHVLSIDGRRRPRSEFETTGCASSDAGADRTTRWPSTVGALSGTTGAVLDPILSSGRG